VGLQILRAFRELVQIEAIRPKPREEDRMSGFKRKLMASAEEWKVAAQVSNAGQIATPSRPCRPQLRRWHHRGLWGSVTLADIGAPELSRLKQHLFAFQKRGAVVPISGLVGILIDRFIRVLVELEASPSKPQEKTK
jgi:hypothetical protein